MFLDAVRTRHPGLIRFATELHQSGAIAPNTFVIDRGAVRRNAVKLVERAQKLGLNLYYMAKQIAYDHLLVADIRAAIPQAVAVDWMGAQTLLEQKARLGHVGHLVPVPVHSMAYLLRTSRPEVWTLFDLEAAQLLSGHVVAAGYDQAVLLRVVGEHDDFFPGQEGGFPLGEIVAAANEIARLPGLRVAGVTSYPCFTWDAASERYIPTSNLHTVLDAADRLRKAGHQIVQVNAPGNTSLSVLPLLAQYGTTHGEPGHALTGTNPEQSTGRSEEEPAAVYVSEISTVLPTGQALAYGGGLYARAHAQAALVGGPGEDLVESAPIPVHFPPPQFIDYQCPLDVPDGRRIHVGDTVIMAFRFQLFVQRSMRAIVEQDAAGQWQLLTSTR